jgi:anti-sigma regulatory factor (Ser/Thr protein kinase)
MDNNHHIRYLIPDRSYSNIVKREIHKLAVALGFSSKKLAEIDIIAAEIISNLNKHTPEGELLVKSLQNIDGRAGLEILSIDQGPGIEDLSEMLKDGNSTTGSLGQGLGAINRFSDEFDIYSLPGWGTILLSRVFISPFKLNVKPSAISINTIMLPKRGEAFCGDGWKVITRNGEHIIIALDGLGHGPEAHKASEAAIKEFTAIKKSTPAETIRILHRQIRGTRGAVGMIFHINTLNNALAFAGLGNISARIIGHEKNKNCISYNGIIGHNIPNTLNTNHIQWQRNETLIINSDGLKSRWDLGHLPDILYHDGSILSAALYKDFSRGSDDLLIIVVKNQRMMSSLAPDSQDKIHFT